MIQFKPWKSKQMVHVYMSDGKKTYGLIDYFRPGIKQIKIRSILCETPFFRKWFYGAGYEYHQVRGYTKRLRYIYVKHRFQYPLAVICEWMRLFYYNKIK